MGSLIFSLATTLLLWIGFGFLLMSLIRRFDLREARNERTHTEGFAIPFLMGAGIGTFLQFIFSIVHAPLWLSLSTMMAASAFGWIQFGWEECMTSMQRSIKYLQNNRWQYVGWFVSILFLIVFFVRSTSKTI
ncbi:MAG TPA: hypothetical protein VJ246_01675, partial [Patescibacteria group bacterium]|nr:hypothetical protein [Patescibacteria group bacterium]